MGISKKITLRANVEVQKDENGKEDWIALHVASQDGSSLTSNQIIEAVAEALLLHWNNAPIEPWNVYDYDA